MIQTEVLDVTLLEPRRKHPTIFEAFDRLEPGESFVLHNDHDPKPLYYQLLGERGPSVSWEYLQQGPEVWEVRLGKASPEHPTIGELAAADMRKIQVFKKYKLDYCCGGKKTLQEACSDKNLDPNRIQEELDTLDRFPQQAPGQNFHEWDLDFLADYIQRVHHSFARKQMTELLPVLQKVVRVHGSAHPELKAMLQLVDELAQDLQGHFQKEEQVLFPHIRNLSLLESGGVPGPVASLNSMQSPIQVMLAEHDHAGDLLKTLRTLSDDYRLPEDACQSYRYAFRLLEDFEADFIQHVHLENNILFPKALKLEQNLAEAQ